jgi:adhesin transport system outer membrane protein
MKNRLKRISFWVALTVLPASSFISFSAFAQQQTLKEATQQAILTNPEVLNRWHAFEAAGAERDVAFGGYLPNVNLSAAAGRNQNDNRFANNNLNRRSAALSLNQMLYDGFLTRSEVSRLDHSRLVRLFELYDASENTALEVVRAYTDILRYRKLTSLAEDNYVRHKTVFEQIQNKVKAGAGRRVDLEQISGRLALAEANLLTETSNLHDVSARYLRLVGVAPSKDLENPAPLIKDIPGNINTALDAANKHHPSLLAAIENVRAVDKSVSARRATYQPRVDLRLRTERGNNIENITGGTTNNTAEVVLSWNLFNGGSDKARVRQSSDLLNLARDQRDKACRDIRQTLSIAYNDTRKLTEQLTFLDQHQLSIEKARDAYRQQFDIGQRSLLDVLDTENEVFQAKRAFANAEYDLLQAYARTHAGMGTLYSALGISRQTPEALPKLGEEDHADIAVNCPTEAPQLYLVDKATLDARAAEGLVQEAPGQSKATPAVTDGQTPKLTATATALAKTAVITSLKNWRDAWISLNPDNYFAFYAPKYTSRESWKTARKARLLNAQKITLELNDIQVTMQDPRHATSVFEQTYASASYQDQLKKTLHWEEMAGKWLIVNETVEDTHAKQ